MGASPYYYFVDYQPDINAALQTLREREFRAGRYNPVMPFPAFPITETSPSPGARHASIQAALEASEEEGTRSILDLDHVVAEYYDENSDRYGSVAPLSDAVLEALLGTNRPSTQQLDDFSFDLIEEINRGMGIYVLGYAGDTPKKILFAGYSFD